MTWKPPRPGRPRAIPDEKAEEIIRSVVAGEKTAYAWAKELGVSYPTIYAITRGKAYEHVAPALKRVRKQTRADLVDRAAKMRAAKQKKHDEIRQLARAAAPYRVKIGALKPEDVDAWVEAQLKLHLASERAVKKRAKVVERYGQTRQKRKKREASRVS